MILPSFRIRLDLVAALHGWTESVARHRIYRGLRSLRNLDA
jgi:hypothetical protein